MVPKNHIGDGVYVEDDGYGIVITTENGISVQNRIVMEPEVIEAFERYVARFRKLRK